MNDQVDTYIQNLPDWQRQTAEYIRRLIHTAVPEIHEEIKFTNRPYFTYHGNVSALLAAKDHLNVFIYDPIAPDPAGLINQGQGNATARSIQIYDNELPDEKAFIALIQAVAKNNEQGGWRKLEGKKQG